VNSDITEFIGTYLQVLTSKIKYPVFNVSPRLQAGVLHFMEQKEVTLR